MSFNDQIETYMVCILNTYSDLQRQQYEYCAGVPLYPTEIHAIECIAAGGPINVTELANMLGMSKGGVSKCAVKLENRGLIKRYKYMENNKEVYLHLTELGLKAYQGHQQYHQKMDETMEAYGAMLNPEQREAVLCFLKTYLAEMQDLQQKQYDQHTNQMKGE